MKGKLRSFTLVELMVVITVILILAAFTIMSLGPVRAKSRDTRRISDANIIVSASGFRNTEGYIAALLFDSAEGFPENPEHAAGIYLSDIEEETQTFSFNDIKYGTYAVSVIHDERGSVKPDLYWEGFPKEGLGVSGSSRPAGRPPEFGDSVFEVSSSTVSIDIEIRYLESNQ